MDVSQKILVRLDGREPFAVGGRRLCFIDPRDPSRCIKVNRRDREDVFRHRRSGMLLPARLRRPYDNNRDEQKELSKLFRRIGSEDYAHLPRAYGFVKTDYGPGLVQDLIRDADGCASRNLRELVEDGYDVEEFRPAFDELSEYMLKHRVLTRELPDHNLTAQRLGDGRWRLYIIDGMGDRAWLPVAEFVAPLGRARVLRRLESCWRRLAAEASGSRA